MKNTTTMKTGSMETKVNDPELKTVLVTETVEIPQSKEKVITDLGHQKLLSCLYFIFDAFERIGMDFFLVKDTARKAINEDMLSGDHIDIGVRDLEWTNDEKEVLFTYFGQEHVQEISNLPHKITFKWNGVTFTIHQYPDSFHLQAPVIIVYEHEHWKIPNRFDIFDKEGEKT